MGSVQSIWLGTAVLLLALYGTAPTSAATLSGGVLEWAQPKLDPPGGSVLLVKNKKERKSGKRHGLRKKLRKHRAHKHRGKARRHISRRPHRHEFVIILRVDPDRVVRLPLRLEPVPAEPHRQRRLGPSQSPMLVDPSFPDADEPPVRAKRETSLGSSGPVPCDHAIGIVRNFGFSEVEVRGCSGATYEFAAVRDGQPYSIRLRSADGELTEVRRQ